VLYLILYVQKYRSQRKKKKQEELVEWQIKYFQSQVSLAEEQVIETNEENT